MVQIHNRLGYSEYWRKNKSAVESQELINVLLALRKVGRHIASNVRTIEWSGMSAPDPVAKIEINVGLARGEYPLPADKMDILVGIAAREAFHCKIHSDVVLLKLKKKLGEVPPDLDFLVGIGEDIFTKRIAKDTVWKYYLPFCWPYVRSPNKRDVARPPTVSSLLHIFADYVLSDRLAVNMHRGYHDIFQRLLTARDEICDCIKEMSILKRCNHRVDTYQHLWSEVTESAALWDSDDSFEGLPATQGGTAKAEEGVGQLVESCDLQEEQCGMDRSETESSLRLMQYMKDVMDEHEDKGINEQMVNIADEEKSRIIDTFFVKSDLPCRIDPDPALASRLRRIFQLQRLLRTRHHQYQRALPWGKIDGRRLYRFAIDGRLFRQREYIYRNNNRNIAILIDGSASMTGGLPGGGKDWARTEQVFASLSEAIKGTGNRLDVFAYCERGGVCEVSCLAHNNRLYTVRPGGRTPTGQAIVATVLKMPKNKRRLIIHVTDGEPNCGISVKKGLDFCDREGVEIVTIGAYYDEKMKALLERQYANRAILVDSLELLPARLEETLKASLLI
jgi:hypothetical protein